MLRVSCLVIKTSKPVSESASKLRGFVGRRFTEYPILHHHAADGEYLYTYPRVQYRVIAGVPQILGIEEGARVLREISDELTELVLGGRRYRITQKILYEQEVKPKPARVKQYKFITPWLALNPENYRKYKEIRDWKEKKNLLNRILVGNILAMCKSFGIVVRKRLHAHSLLEPEKVRYKGVEVLGFTGEFRVNFAIPELFGLGKGVSQGFGVVMNAPGDR